MPTDQRVRGDAPLPPVAPIRTTRLELVSMSIPFMRALAAEDVDAAAREMDADLPSDITEDLADFLRYRLAQLEVDPSIREWLGRAMVLTHEDGRREVIGTIGFHGPPDEQGRLEVGYRVQADHRRQGYAREAVLALFDWAHRERGVRRFIASISPTNEPSLNLTRSLGFVRTGEQMDEIDGLEHVFEADWPPR